MKPTATSFHGFAGAFAVALQKQGFDLEKVVEPGGFGIGAIKANAYNLEFGGRIHTEDGAPFSESNVLVGNPPCSGFSLINTSKKGRFRGPESEVNACMWAFMRYAAGMNRGRGPAIAVFESVQGAGKQGKKLMNDLVLELGRLTEKEYTLHSVFMSGASVGAAQIRRRYFWVASRIPFGIESPKIAKVPTYYDAIGDLENLVGVRDRQAYRHQPSWWVFQHGLRNSEPTVASMDRVQTAWTKRMEDVAPYWNQGENHRAALARSIAVNGRPPQSWAERDVDKELYGTHFSGAYRVRENECGHVIAGDGGMSFVHYREDRTLSVREVSRLMGFPDWFDWSYTTPTKAFSHQGKQVPVQSWEWILGWVKRALEGRPGQWAGTPDLTWGPERVYDVTNDFKLVYNERSKVQGDDSCPKHIKLAIDRRPA